jgi:hypothetical protein
LSGSVSGRLGQANPPDRYAILVPPGGRFAPGIRAGNTRARRTTIKTKAHRMEHDAAPVFQSSHDALGRRSRNGMAGRSAGLKNTVQIVCARPAVRSAR